MTTITISYSASLLLLDIDHEELIFAPSSPLWPDWAFAEQEPVEPEFDWDAFIERMEEWHS